MAAELDYSTGDAAFVEFGDRVTAWHRDGRAIIPARFAGLSGEEKVQLILTEGRMDWEVLPYDVLAPVSPVGSYTVGPVMFGEKIKGWKQFRRSDNGKLMGIFPESYTPLQNRDLLTLVEPMLDVGMATFETAGSLREGEDVWGLFRFNPKDPVVQEFFTVEQIIPYMLLSNNHARKRMVTIMETPIRVVCANTLGMALGVYGKKRKAGRYPGAVLLRHTKNVKSLSVDAVNNLWGTITERYAAVAGNYETLKSRWLLEEEFEENVLDLIAPLPVNVESPLFHSTLDRAMDRRRLITELWNGAGRGITGDHSAWEAYNATAEALDWYEDNFPTRAKNRLQAIYPGGSLANKKQDVLNALTTLASDGQRRIYN